MDGFFKANFSSNEELRKGGIAVSQEMKLLRSIGAALNVKNSLKFLYLDFLPNSIVKNFKISQFEDAALILTTPSATAELSIEENLNNNGLNYTDLGGERVEQRRMRNKLDRCLKIYLIQNSWKDVRKNE